MPGAPAAATLGRRLRRVGIDEVAQIAAANSVTFGTAQRGQVTVLKNEGLVDVSRGRRARVAASA